MASNISLLTATAALVVLLALFGYMKVSGFPQQKAQPVGIANPASTNCANLGGRHEVQVGTDGGEVGFCVLPDGSICEEWNLFREGTCTAPEAR